MDHGTNHPRILFLSLAIVLLLGVGIFYDFNKTSVTSLPVGELPDISEEVSDKSDTFVAARAIQSYVRARSALLSANTNVNFSSLLTREDATDALEAYQNTEAYAVEALKRAVAAYEKDKTSVEARRALIAAVLALRAGALSKQAAASASAISEAATEAEMFSTSPLGQAAGAVGISRQVSVSQSGPQVVTVANLNTGGGAGAFAAAVSGLPFWGVLGNAVGGAFGSASLGQVTISQTGGASFNITIPTSGAAVSGDSGTVGVISPSDIQSAGGFDYGGFDRPENLPSGASSSSCVPGYGSLCTSGANVCGVRNPGRITCGGYCSAITPGPDACPTPSIYTSGDTVFVRPGQSCTFTWVAENAQVCHFYGTYNSSPFSFWTGTAQKFESVPLSRRQLYSIDCFADKQAQSVSSRRTVSCIPSVPTTNEQ